MVVTFIPSSHVIHKKPIHNILSVNSTMKLTGFCVLKHTSRNRYILTIYIALLYCKAQYHTILQCTLERNARYINTLYYFLLKVYLFNNIRCEHSLKKIHIEEKLSYYNNDGFIDTLK